MIPYRIQVTPNYRNEKIDFKTQKKIYSAIYEKKFPMGC